MQCSVFLVLLIVAADKTTAETGATFKDWLLGEQAQAGTDELIQSNPDEVSGQCLSCHNGDRATRIIPKAAGLPVQFQGTVSSNHPIGMDYDFYASRKPHAYKSRVVLDPVIRLVDGRVSCISCHLLKRGSPETAGGFIKVSSYNNQHDQQCLATNKLTAGPSTTKLCLSCHIMK